MVLGTTNINIFNIINFNWIINRINIKIISQDINIIVSVKKGHRMWISTSNDQHRLFVKINVLIDEKIGLHQLMSAITTTLHTTGIIVNIDIIRSIVHNINRNISIINVIITVNVGNAKIGQLVLINEINGQHHPQVELNEPIDETTDLHQVIVATTMTVRTSTDVERKSIIQNGTVILHQATVMTNPTVVLLHLMNRQIG